MSVSTTRYLRLHSKTFDDTPATSGTLELTDVQLFWCCDPLRDHLPLPAVKCSIATEASTLTRPQFGCCTLRKCFPNRNRNTPRPLFSDETRSVQCTREEYRNLAAAEHAGPALT